MNRILADLAAFGRQYLRSKIGAFFAFVFPILLILLFGAIFSNVGSSTISLHVQDLDNTDMSRGFVQILNQTNLVRVTMVSPAEDLEEYIKEESLDVALQIPQDFQGNVLLGLPANVTLYGDPSRSTFNIAQSIVNVAVVQMNYNVKGVTPVVGMRTESVASSTFQYMDFFIPGIVGMTIMTNAMFSMTSVCAEYRTRRYFKLLATTTLRKSEWLTSKILWYLVLMIASLFATLGVGYAIWQVHVYINAAALILIALGTLLFTSLGMLIGTVIKDPESGAAVANAIGFPMMFLSGTFWPIESMPEYLQSVAKVLPLTYLNEGLRDAMVYSNWDGVLTNLGVLAALAVVFFILASKLMSWKGE